MITIRLAQPHEGPLVGELFVRFGGPDWGWADWSDVYPYWLIGDVDNTPKGVMMVNPGKSFGRMEFLAVDPTLPQSTKAILCRDLSYAGIATCQRLGSQSVLSNIDSSDKQWKAIAEKRGWVITGSGDYMMKRCV